MRSRVVETHQQRRIRRKSRSRLKRWKAFLLCIVSDCFFFLFSGIQCMQTYKYYYKRCSIFKTDAISKYWRRSGRMFWTCCWNPPHPPPPVFFTSVQQKFQKLSSKRPTGVLKLSWSRFYQNFKCILKTSALEPIRIITGEGGGSVWKHSPLFWNLECFEYPRPVKTICVQFINYSWQSAQSDRLKTLIIFNCILYPVAVVNTRDTRVNILIFGHVKRWFYAREYLLMRCSVHYHWIV